MLHVFVVAIAAPWVGVVIALSDQLPDVLLSAPVLVMASWFMYAVAYAVAICVTGPLFYFAAKRLAASVLFPVGAVIGAIAGWVFAATELQGLPRLQSAGVVAGAIGGLAMAWIWAPPAAQTSADDQ
jgi:hypothetical protein